MTGYNKIFLDTTPLIYFLDSDVNFGEKTKRILEEVISEGKESVTAAITYGVLGLSLPDRKSGKD